MKILFAAPENAWGGFLNLIRSAVPEHEFKATGGLHIETLEGYDVLIPTMATVTQETLKSCDRLKLIQQCGSGLELVDIEAAVAQGIRVANVPTDISGNADSVAEVGIYMMIGLSRDVRSMARSLVDRQMGFPQGRALFGRTVGLVGLGGIAQALIRRLKTFDVKLMGIKRNNPREAGKQLGLEWAGTPDELDVLLQRSDFVILCLPVTAESQGIMNRLTLQQMKNDAFLINLSRGGLVDRKDLEDALASGEIAGAGLDVFWEEPPDPDDPVFNYNVMATPHIGGSTDNAMKGIVAQVAANIRRVADNKEPLHQFEA
ncbi:MAG: 2-hydroxyacid dehydrogenase [Thermodesulfobacteriota bacterium]